MVGGSERARPFSQRGGHDTHAAAGRFPLQRIEETVERIEERGTGFGDAAAENDDLRVERIDKRDDPAREPTYRPQPDRRRLGVASAVRPDELFRRLEAASRTLL